MDVISTARAESEAGRLPADTARKLASDADIDVAGLMLALIPLASEQANPNLSNYQVGAVGEGLSGDLYFGANFELPEGPLAFTIHGEQAVVINAMQHGESGLSRLAISAQPCGVCRQFLWELETAGTLQILLRDAPPVQLPDSLPGAFGPSDLGLEGGLMAGKVKEVLDNDDCGSDLKALASMAAANSYAPYTGSLAGIAVRLDDDSTFSGFTIENAAFNPSIFPLQVALSSMAMAGRKAHEISEVVHLELSGSPVSSVAVTEILLKQIAPHSVFSADTIHVSD